MDLKSRSEIIQFLRSVDGVLVTFAAISRETGWDPETIRDIRDGAHVMTPAQQARLSMIMLDIQLRPSVYYSHSANANIPGKEPLVNTDTWAVRMLDDIREVYPHLFGEKFHEGALRYRHVTIHKIQTKCRLAIMRKWPRQNWGYADWWSLKKCLAIATGNLKTDDRDPRNPLDNPVYYRDEARG